MQGIVERRVVVAVFSAICQATPNFQLGIPDCTVLSMMLAKPVLGQPLRQLLLCVSRWNPVGFFISISFTKFKDHFRLLGFNLVQWQTQQTVCGRIWILDLILEDTSCVTKSKPFSEV